MDAKRLFAGVAVEATEPLRRLTGELRQELGNGRIRWVRMDHLHLTVEFFGATAVDRIPALEQALAEAAAASGPFSLRTGSMGLFGSLRHPRVLWLGIESEGLSTLHGGVQETLRGAGWMPEARAYSPHLTLARLDGWREASKLEGLLERHRADRIPEQCVEELILYESVRDHRGNRYEKRNRWRLGKR